MIRKTTGIILKTYDLRETSKIVVFFTRDYGKLKGVLKGIRKDPKKFGSSLEKFSVNDIVYYWHADTELQLVGQCDLISYYFPIRKDLKRLMAAQYMLELVDVIMPTEEPNPQVYRLMIYFLESLETIHDINKLIHVFQIKILHYSGFRPHIEDCLSCQKTIQGRAKMSLKLGGLICLQCLERDLSAISISKGAIASMLHVEKSPWPKTLQLGLSRSIQKELKMILNNFLVYHLEKRIKSEQYLQ